MLNLFKTDLKKMLTDKLFIIAFGVSVALAIILPLLWLLIENIAKDTSNPFYVSVMDYSFSPFNITTNGGIVSLILLSIAVSKEFSNGNIRNKVIVGNKRNNIYASLSLTFFLAFMIIMLVSSIITLLVGIIFHPYSRIDATTGELIGTYFLSLLMGILMNSVIIALSLFFTIGLNKAALGIIIPIILSFGLSLVSSIIITMGGAEKLEYILYLNVIDTLSNLNRNIYSVKEYFIRLIPFILTPALYIGGNTIFNSTDLK